MRYVLFGIASVACLAGCAPPQPTTPAQAAARSAAAFEYTARYCAGRAGGFSDLIAIRRQAEARYAMARKLGATEALIQQEKNTVQSTVGSAEMWVGKEDTCSTLITEAAMNAT